MSAPIDFLAEDAKRLCEWLERGTMVGKRVETPFGFDLWVTTRSPGLVLCLGRSGALSPERTWEYHEGVSAKRIVGQALGPVYKAAHGQRMRIAWAISELETVLGP
jgi:hypothetical protein